MAELGKRKKVSKTPILLLLAKNVKQIRTERGMTQEKLAEKAQLHPTYISNIEQGTRNVSLETVYQIAVALEVGVDQLVKGELEK